MHYYVLSEDREQAVFDFITQLLVSMASKIRKLLNGKKENSNKNDKLSVNRLEEREIDGPVSVNRALEEERAENDYTAKSNSVKRNNLLNSMEDKEMPLLKGEAKTSKAENFNDRDKELSAFILKGEDESYAKENTLKGGKKLLPNEKRDPKIDETPVEEKDLGLPKDNILIQKKVSADDLYVQNEAQDKQFLGANVRKKRDFVSIFRKGKSSKLDPKLDLTYNIKQNPVLKKELIAQQLLKNIKSKSEAESRNTAHIFEEMELKDDEEFNDNITENAESFNENDLIKKIVKKLT